MISLNSPLRTIVPDSFCYAILNSFGRLSTISLNLKLQLSISTTYFTFINYLHPKSQSANEIAAQRRDPQAAARLSDAREQLIKRRRIRGLSIPPYPEATFPNHKITEIR